MGFSPLLRVGGHTDLHSVKLRGKDGLFHSSRSLKGRSHFRSLQPSVQMSWETEGSSLPAVTSNSHPHACWALASLHLVCNSPGRLFANTKGSRAPLSPWGPFHNCSPPQDQAGKARLLVRLAPAGSSRRTPGSGPRFPRISVASLLTPTSSPNTPPAAPEFSPWCTQPCHSPALETLLISKAQSSPDPSQCIEAQALGPSATLSRCFACGASFAPWTLSPPAMC